VCFAQVDAEERPLDAAAANGGARRGDVDPRRVAPEVAAPEAVDVEAFDGHVRASYADNTPGPGAHEARTSLAAQGEGPVDHEVAYVFARRHDQDVARRGSVHPALQRRGLRQRRTALNLPGRRQMLLAAQTR
jgi:hypothetical protein